MSIPNSPTTSLQTKLEDKSTITKEKRNHSRNTSIQSVSSDVFNLSAEMEDGDFETPKRTIKRHLSSPKSDSHEANK